MPLPPGLALNRSTGVVSGTPTVPGTYNFTLRVRDAQGNTRDIPQSIVIDDYTAPSLSGAISQFATKNVLYSSGLTVMGGTGPYVWSIASGTLPSGLTINASTGVISGTPGGVSFVDREITIRVVDAAGSSAQLVQLLRFADVVDLSGGYLAATEGVAYSDGLTVTGGHTPLVWSITSGSIPPGLTFDTGTGIFSGTPSTQGSYPIGVRATDAAGNFDAFVSSIEVASAYTPISITGSVTNGTQNVEVLSAFSIMPTYSGLSIANGNTPYSYSWARISGSTAISAAAPTSFDTSFIGNVAPGANVSAVFRCTVSDGTSSATFDVTVDVTNTYVAMALSATLDPATRTVGYSDTLTRTGGASPYTFVVTAGTLPTGISLNGATGALTGTPTDTGYTDRSMSFRVTDALGATANVSVTLRYANLPTLSYGSTAASMRTRAFTLTPTRNGGHAPYSFALISGSLPTGLSLDSGTGAVTGTPSGVTYGPFVAEARLTDAAGNEVDAEILIDNYDNLVVAGTVGGTGYVSSAYSDSSLGVTGGQTPFAWSIAGGSLPGGLSINSSTGAITGTPTTVATNNFTVRATDAYGYTADSAQTITIGAALAVSASPNPVTSLFTNSPASSVPSTRTLSTGTVTASGSGGSGGYSYAWTRISGSADITADSPAAAATTFTGTGIPIGGSKTATFRCTVTDSGARTSTTDVPVEIQYDSGL